MPFYYLLHLTTTLCEVLQKYTLLHFINLLEGINMGFHAILSKLRQCTYTNGAREIGAIFKPWKWKGVME